MRGGARPGAGRPPAENSRAKDRARKAAAKGTKPVVIDDGTWLTLPFEGRGGNPPAWPLSQASKREREVWRQLWKLPQAIAWEMRGSTFQVALHVRMLVRAEEVDSPIGASNLVRLQQHELGLTPPGMATLKWKVAKSPRMQQQVTSTHPAAEPDAQPSPPVASSSPRDRLRVVTPHVAG